MGNEVVEIRFKVLVDQERIGTQVLERFENGEYWYFGPGKDWHHAITIAEAARKFAPNAEIQIYDCISKEYKRYD